MLQVHRQAMHCCYTVAHARKNTYVAGTRAYRKQLCMYTCKWTYYMCAIDSDENNSPDC